MSNRTWVTPEEIAKRKKLKKRALYISFPILTGAISALVTVLASKL
ncbi:hypothetical protein [Bacillus sp. J33]|nr:hypothetical protein [Bacillus sp. J33]